MRGRHGNGAGLLRFSQSPLATIHPQDERQHLGDGLIKLHRDLTFELDTRQRRGKTWILLDRNTVSLGRLDDAPAKFTVSLGDNAGCAWLLVGQRDGERSGCRCFGHDARSTKRPAGGFTGRGGSPSRTSTSAASRST